MFNKSQFGFKKNKSTEDAVTIIENVIENLNKMKCKYILIKSI
jgi:hypothetical protein